MTLIIEKKRAKNKIKIWKERKRGKKNITLKKKRILAEYFMTYNRVHERGGKGITKNIQDNIWQREEWGKYKMWVEQI